MGFTDAGRPDQQDALMRSNEASRGQFDEFRAGYLGIEGKIKVRKLLDLDNACLFEAACKEPVGTSCEFVGNDEFEELSVIQWCTACLFETTR